MIDSAFASGKLSKPEAFVLRSFVHGCLGSLVFKKRAEHAYGRTSKFDDDLVVSLRATQLQLQCGSPRSVSSTSLKCWHVSTDAAYEQNSKSGGLGAVLLDGQADVCSWFGIEVSHSTSLTLGAKFKQSLIYELRWQQP